MRPVYGRSPWVDRFPKSRVPSYPKHRGELDVEVAIIGGGLTGCATAYAFAAANIPVALFEADQIGRGSSGSASGWMSDEPAVGFAALDKRLGRRAARHAWQTWRKAAADFAALLRKLDIKCYAEPRESLTVAVTSEQQARLAREQKARADAGIDAAALTSRQVGPLTGFAAVAALRSRDGGVLDPYRATLGLAAAARKRGARIFERSAVTKTAFTRETASLVVNGGPVTARRIIVATGTIPALFKPLARHAPPRTTFLVLTEPVPARVRKSLGTREQFLRDLAEPSHRIAWVDAERLLIAGADSDAVAERLRDSVLVQRTGQLMYELSMFYPEISGLQPAYGWDCPYATTATELPIVGPHRNYPHHLFAVGDGSQSVTGAFLASRILLRQHLDEPEPADAVFGFPH